MVEKGIDSRCINTKANVFYGISLRRISRDFKLTGFHFRTLKRKLQVVLGLEGSFFYARFIPVYLLNLKKTSFFLTESKERP